MTLDKRHIISDSLIKWLYKGILFSMFIMIFSCNQKSETLSPVTIAQFEKFIDETAYVTDAEKYGWSIVQINVFDFETVNHATWRMPDGINEYLSKDLPVTQVSYNDAIAYCKWVGSRLPTYDEFWELTGNDKRPIVSDNLLPISDVNNVNVIGNVWDITESVSNAEVRLAGGSLFCSKKMCNGTVRERELYVDKETGNIHIGFSVIQ